VTRRQAEPPHGCEGVTGALNDARVPIEYLPKYREYALVLEDGPVLQLISFCPWCGEELPRSVRDQFFEHLEAMNLDPEDSRVPLDFRSDAWWRLRSIE
jgi:hypothetical protein